ncbi:MAG: hypothetical protein C0622_08585 [Desulfuromonas sp.]|nr:MAG: hypothetical protein C0622_08585 [Desulfuromonas sp.]
MGRYYQLRIALFAGVLLLAGYVGNAAAALTEACTEISNQATLDYKVGTVDQDQILSDDDGSGSDPTVFKVATLVNLTNVTEVSPTSVIPNDTNDYVITFKITNTGNDDARYMLQLYDRDGETVGTDVDGFDMTTVRVYSDTDATYGSGGTEVLVAASETAQDGSDLGLAPGDPTAADDSAFVAPAGVIYVHVVAQAPASAADGLKDLFTLRAVAYNDSSNSPGDHSVGATWIQSTDSDDTNGCGVAVVLGDDTDSDGAGGSILDLDSDTPDGAAVATGYFVITTAAITVEKDYEVISDPINGVSVDAKAIPGAVVEYTITVTNTSTSTDASGLALVDPIPTNTDYVVGSADPSGDVTFSNSDTSTWTYVPVGSSGDADAAVKYIKAAKATLPFNDGVDSEHIYTVKFRVIIEE